MQIIETSSTTLTARERDRLFSLPFNVRTLLSLENFHERKSVTAGDLTEIEYRKNATQRARKALAA